MCAVWARLQVCSPAPLSGSDPATSPEVGAAPVPAAVSACCPEPPPAVHADVSPVNNTGCAPSTPTGTRKGKITCLHFVSALINCVCDSTLLIYFEVCELVKQTLILGLQSRQLFLVQDALLLPLCRAPLMFLQRQTRTIILHITSRWQNTRTCQWRH